jgi:hypothetical protein
MKKTLRENMSSVSAKYKKLKATPWKNLTTGEKVLRVVTKLLKWAVIIALIVTIGSVVLAVVAGVGIALAICNALAGGFHNAGQAYSGRRYYDDRYYDDRDIW